MKKRIGVPVWGIALMLFVQVMTFVILFLVTTNRFPPTDRGSAIYSLRTTKDVQIVVDMFQQVLDEPAPRYRIDDQYVKRAMLWDGTIFNSPSPEALKQVEGRMSALGRVTNDPYRRSLEAVDFLKARGIKATCIHDPDLNIPKGSMSFVMWPDCDWILVLRKSFDKMGPQPPPWNDYKK